MITIGSKIAKLQDSNFRITPTNSNETSLFLPQELADAVGLANDTDSTFYITKINLMQMLAYIFSLKIDLIYGKSKWAPSWEEFRARLDTLDAYFHHRDVAEYTIHGVVQTENRKYFNGLKKQVGISNSYPAFNIRDFFLEGYTEVFFEKHSDGRIFIRLALTSEPEIGKDENIEAPTVDGVNRIYFGAPGSGKSHDLELERQVSFDDDHYERVTFYPTYSYSQFVGTYKPIMAENGTDVKYDYSPGPFIRVWTKAYKALNNNPENPQKFLLIIEELNRANAAAVFGDTFQLLDRNEFGESEYPIAISEDLKRFLRENEDIDIEKMIIPPNMYIWATMNSADQGVFPLDTAFKRRWDYEYFGVDKKDEDIKNIIVTIAGKNYYWNEIRKAINKFLMRNRVNEDKCLGAYFLKMSVIQDNKKFIEAFKNKVLMYLYEDAARQCRKDMFTANAEGDLPAYSEICNRLMSVGMDIFKFKVSEINEEAEKTE